MGKVHRIKRDFRKILSQQPISAGNYSLGRTVSVLIGRRIDGSLYAITWGNAYNKLVDSLMQEYNARGVALCDKTFAKG